MTMMKKKKMQGMMDDVGRAAVAKNMPWTMMEGGRGKGRLTAPSMVNDESMPQPKKSKKTRLGGEVV
jgi:hypothetical protein